MSDENVVILPVVTTLDIPPERILSQAIAADLDRVIVVGYDQDGQEYFASSVADGGTVVWLMERAKIKLLRMVDE